ncbi:MAG: hypothetical protein ACRC7N_19145 [Clostridium sp.]
MEYMQRLNKELNKYDELKAFNIKIVIINNLKGVVYLIPLVIIWTKLFLIFSENFNVENRGTVLHILLNAIIVTIFTYGIMIILSGLNRIVYYFDFGIYNITSFLLPVALFIIVGSLFLTSGILYILIITPLLYLIFTTINRHNYLKKLNSFFLY